MKIASRIHVEGDLHRFEIVDEEDQTVTASGEVLVESLHVAGKAYANESTAKRHAESWIKKFIAASERVRRTLCGYTAVPGEDRDQKVHPVRRKIGTKSTS